MQEAVIASTRFRFGSADRGTLEARYRLPVGVAGVFFSIVFVIKTVAGLKIHQIIGGILRAVLVIIVPVTIAAFIKPGRRNLSSPVEQCGWAVNASFTPFCSRMTY